VSFILRCRIQLLPSPVLSQNHSALEHMLFAIGNAFGNGVPVCFVLKLPELLVLSSEPTIIFMHYGQSMIVCSVLCLCCLNSATSSSV
jgi:hypothetical protein